MTPRFVHLHLHTEYSLVDGLIRVKALAKAIARLGMPAVAVTDQSNLFSMVKFYRAALAVGIKPIVGVDIWIQNEIETDPPYKLVLLCKDLTGYKNLTHLVSKSYLDGQHRGIPMLKREWLQAHSVGLIALSGAREGDVGRSLLSNKNRQAQAYAKQWKALFPDSFYLEIQRTGRVGEEYHLSKVVALAEQLSLPVVATNDVRFLQKEQFEAHEARVCIFEGRTLDDTRRSRNYSEEQYLRSAEEMCELFSDIPEALANSVEIAKRCNLELELGKNYLPDFPVPAGMSVADFLRQQAQEGLAERLKRILPNHQASVEDSQASYQQRLEMELDVIIQMGFPGYFLIVADFIRWAKANAVPVGPGRGSGAGSLVAYALQITDLDPIEHELLFERFLNPERVSMPDFDVDFCMEQRDRVIDYVAQRYGRDKVSQIITYGTMAAKAVVRDVGRVLGHPYGFVDRIAKLIPFEIGMTLEKALQQEDDLKSLYEEEEDVQTLIDLARSLEGIARNAGKHAGGVVIAPSKLTDFTPLYCEQGSKSIVSQFDKDDVEAVGLVKFDFLGLRTLTIIDWAIQTINRQAESQRQGMLDISAIPMDDVATFDLLKRCATTAVFQLESRGMKDLIKRLQPDCFDDIIALVALFRPGPLQSGMVDDFIDRKHGRAKVEYPHPDVAPILKPTYGVILYQEQVMQIAQVLAGYTLGGADLLRRAMGKKKPEEMAKQRSIFTEGAVARGVDKDVATYIFDLMEKFAGYGFNKSHSAAYALVSYQTAWLKAHYPAAFMAAVLSSDMDNTDKVVTLIEECRDMRLQVLPPGVNESEYPFTTLDEETIVYGLGAIKGVGRAAIDSICQQRLMSGAFHDFFDFCCRIDLRKANKRVLEALVRSGALDKFEPNRAALMAKLPAALKLAEQQSRDQALGMNDLFADSLQQQPKLTLETHANEVAPWSEEQRLMGEKETLGLYLTGHPIARYETELEKFTTGRINELINLQSNADTKLGLDRNAERDVVVAGLMISLRMINTRRGRMAVATLDDRSARIEAVLYSDTFETFRNALVKDKVMVVKGKLSPDDFSGGYRITVEHLFSIEEARERFAKRLTIRLVGIEKDSEFVQSLASVLDPYRDGPCPIWLHYQSVSATAQLPLGDEWKVHPTDELINRINELMGNSQVHIVY